MWRTIAKLLWAFQFSEAEDKQGRPIAMDPEAYTNGLTREPLEYKIKVTSRSTEHAATIRKELESAREFLSAYE